MYVVAGFSLNAFRKFTLSNLAQQSGPFCEENLRSRPRERQMEKRCEGAEIPVG